MSVSGPRLLECRRERRRVPDRGEHLGPRRPRAPSPRTRPTPPRAASAVGPGRRARRRRPAARPSRAGRPGVPRPRRPRPRTRGASPPATPRMRRLSERDSRRVSPRKVGERSRITTHQPSPSATTASIPWSSACGIRANAPPSHSSAVRPRSRVTRPSQSAPGPTRLATRLVPSASTTRSSAAPEFPACGKRRPAGAFPDPLEHRRRQLGVAARDRARASGVAPPAAHLLARPPQIPAPAVQRRSRLATRTSPPRPWATPAPATRGPLRARCRSGARRSPRALEPSACPRSLLVSSTASAASSGPIDSKLPLRTASFSSVASSITGSERASPAHAVRAPRRSRRPRP